MTIFNRKPSAKAGVISLASSLLVLTSVVASAQDTQAGAEQPQIEEVIVKGTRLSLQNAQNIKRDSDTFVDVVTASDIGALPDRSVLESIQRLPGVQIGRFAGADDPDHFSTEGSGVLIRGLKQVRSEFNGRDSFSASSNNGLSFQDVSPELVGSVDVFKNQTADMIAGGIGGTVSLNTRKPLDKDGLHGGISVDGQVSSIADEWTPTFSGLISDNWDTQYGKFGVLLSYAKSELKKESHGSQTGRWELRPINENVSPDAVTPGFAYVPKNNRYTYDGSFFGAPDKDNLSIQKGEQGVLVPHGAAIRMKSDDRDRQGIDASVQWESPDKTLSATVEFIRSDAQLAWSERRVGPEDSTDSEFNNPQWRLYGNVTGTGSDFKPEQYQFSDQGVFQSGNLSSVSDGWRSDANLRIPGNASWTAADINEFGSQVRTETRYRSEDRTTDDLSAHIVWRPTDQWKFDFDYQNIDADSSIDDNTLFFMTHANIAMNVDPTGDYLKLRYMNPWGFADPTKTADINNQLGPDVDIQSKSYLQHPDSYVFHAAQNFAERAQGNENAYQLDGERLFDDGSFITGVKFGLRYADRQQLVGDTRYNYQPIQPAYQANPGWLNQEDIKKVADIDRVDWSDLQSGNGLTIDGEGNNHNVLLHPSLDEVKNWRNWSTLFDPIVKDRCDTWRSLDQRIDPSKSTVVNGECDDAGKYAIQDGFFRPDELYFSEEEFTAGYVRVDFASEVAGMRFSGNLGVRQVKIKTTTGGSTQFPNIVPAFATPDGVSITDDPTAVSQLFDDPTAGTDVPNGGDLDGDGLDDPRFWGDKVNYYSDSVREFANGASSGNYDSFTTDHTLPSLNLKLELSDDLLLRFAVSQAISTPDIGKKRNYVNISEEKGKATSITQHTPFYGPEFVTVDDGNGVMVTKPKRDDNGNIININAYPGIGSNGVEDKWNAYYIDDNGTPNDTSDDVQGAMVNGTTVKGDGIPDIASTGANPRKNLQEQRTFDPNSVNYAGFSAEAGNPHLKPTKANQADLSLEWYFASVGSVTGTVFYKDLQDFITTGNFTRAITNPYSGVTQNVRFTGPVNGDSATVKGIELAYQQTYDFLPEPFDGFGTQLNYSHIESEGVPNNTFSNTDPDEFGSGGKEIAFSDSLPLEGQSEDIANLVLFYQKYGLDARLAYNWNSEFLLTARDVITTLPVWNDAQGFLDASVKYNFTDNLQLSFQAKNLLNENVVTRTQVDKNKKLFRSTFNQGRSYILRASYSF